MAAQGGGKLLRRPNAHGHVLLSLILGEQIRVHACVGVDDVVADGSQQYVARLRIGQVQRLPPSPAKKSQPLGQVPRLALKSRKEKLAHCASAGCCPSPLPPQEHADGSEQTGCRWSKQQAVSEPQAVDGVSSRLHVCRAGGSEQQVARL